MQGHCYEAIWAFLAEEFRLLKYRDQFKKSFDALDESETSDG